MARLAWRLVPPGTFALALAVYLLTAPAGLTWVHDSADGGDLITAALVTGVAHPTGYPTFTLLARWFTRLPWGTPAWRVTLLSASGGALAAAAVAATMQTWLDGDSKWIAWPLREEAPGATPPLPRGLAALVAGATGLMLAFTTLLWGQSTVAEVYALQAGLAAVLIWTLARWRCGHGRAWAALAGFVLGLALGNHVTAVWLLPLAGTWLLAGRRPLPWRALGVFGVALLAGLAVYAYLPAAASGNPPVNWGDPQSWDGFWWLVSGRLYHSFVFSTGWPDALARLAAWAGLLWRDFLPWGVALALAGLGLAFRSKPWLAAGAVASLLLGLIWAIGYDTSDSLLTLLPGWVIVALGAGLGLAALVRWLVAFRDWGPGLAAALCMVVAVTPLALHWPTQDVHRDRQAEDFLAAIMETVDPEALVVTAGDRATFALWYGRYGLEQRLDVVPVSRDLWSLTSYRETVAATHPQLAGPQPPASFAALVQLAAGRRPVYLAQAGPAPEVPPDVCLGDGLTYRVEPAASTAAGTLYRLLLVP